MHIGYVLTLTFNEYVENNNCIRVHILFRISVLAIRIGSDPDLFVGSGSWTIFDLKMCLESV
jgi:hypothetical protein